MLLRNQFSVRPNAPSFLLSPEFLKTVHILKNWQSALNDVQKADGSVSSVRSYGFGSESSGKGIRT